MAKTNESQSKKWRKQNGQKNKAHKQTTMAASPGASIEAMWSCCSKKEERANGELWLGWTYRTKKVPHAANTLVATAFKICVSHRKNGLLNRLPMKVSFSVFD
jgi:hypothetical protein